ncbi:conserved hypothetical protein [delta proteobacterium NaphS2]|nr:conserved hypothetical protein [delta proteobacterium NaphS2]
MENILTGLDQVTEGEWCRFEGQRLGLLSNQASLNRRLETARNVLQKKLPGHLRVLFGPQHGYGGEDQDNMVETPHAHDEVLNIPVFSLYAESREPAPEMFDLIDTLIVDLQDVGTRVYTFSSTMLGCMRAAARFGKKIVVLDRPNPLGGNILEGNCLSPELLSFVGPASLPMRHGLTMGEMALFFNQIFALECNLEVLPLIGWRRNMTWRETGLRWLMPSPNMPLAETAFVYPGQVLWEGTHVSEGRGTCRPFEIFGAPYFDTSGIRKRLDPKALKGCYLQEYLFRPTFHKWSGQLCRGFMMHILDLDAYRPYHTSLALLQAVISHHGEQFEWKDPPYEYEYEKKPIDMILGSSSLRHGLESGRSLYRLQKDWLPDLETYGERIKTILIYS